MPESAQLAKPPRSSGSSKKKGEGSSSPLSPANLPDIHRPLPFSEAAEKAVLCCMLIGGRDAAAECVEKLRKEHFHIPAHAVVFETLVEMWNRNAPIDLICLTQTLKDAGKLEAVGGAAYVTELATFLTTACNAEYYIEILREKYILREIIVRCTACAAQAYNEQDDVNGLLDEVERTVFSISQERAAAALPGIRQHVIAAVENIEKIYERKGGISGLTTGLPDLDRMIDGLHKAEMVVIAARPSMGKTALALNVVEHVAVDLNLPVAVFSLEMSAAQLVQRLICSRARVSLQRIRDGFVAEGDFAGIQSVASRFSQSAIYLDDTANLSILELRAKARRLKAQHDIQLVVIDYLQLLRSTTQRARENRQIEIAEISSGLKALAKELDIPVLVLAQLNRNPEMRTGENRGRPRLADLRESGAIEQDADVVGLLTREDYYVTSEEQRNEVEGKAVLIIAKQRNGPTGDIPLTFIKEFTRFEPRSFQQDEQG